MSVERIRDILDWSRDLHLELQTVFSQAAGQTGDIRARLLLDYVAEHEQRLADAIRHYEDDHDANGDRLETWIMDYIEKISFVREIREKMQLGEMTSEDILQAVVETHQQLIDLYQDLADNAKTERLQELFQGLAAMESHELMRIVHSSERWSDM